MSWRIKQPFKRGLEVRENHAFNNKTGEIIELEQFSNTGTGILGRSKETGEKVMLQVTVFDEKGPTHADEILRLRPINLET